MSTTTKGGVSSIKKSRSLYATAIYGFIALFIIMVIPFLPTGKDGSLFESGLKRFGRGEYGNLIATISMLCHSIILLVVAVVMVNNLKKYRAGVGYSFYKLFANTINLTLGVFVGFFLTNNMEALSTSYGIEYWFIVLILYAIGLIFALIAQLCNYDLRPSKGKVLYYLLSWGSKIFMLFFVLHRRDTVGTRYMMESWFDGSQQHIIFDTVRQDWVAGVYNTASVIYLFILVLSTVKICMPLNNAFSYMTTRGRKHSKYSPLPIWQHVIYLIACSSLIINMIIANGHEEVWSIILLVLIGVLDIVGAKVYNKLVSSKMYVEEVPKFKGFFKKDEQPATNDVSKPLTETAKEEPRAWSETELEIRNENLDFKDKTSIDKMCKNLCIAVNDRGIITDEGEMQKVLAAILSSKVTFIKSGANSDVLREFADTISTFFGEDLFYERRENPEEEYKSVVTNLAASIESAQEQKPESNSLSALVGDLSTEEKPEEQSSGGTSIADLLAGINSQSSSEQENAEEVASTQDELTPAEVKPVVKPVEKPVYVYKPKTDEEKKRELKYGVAGGLFVANYLYNTFGLVFVDNTAVDAIGDFDADVITAIAGNEEKVFVGKIKGLPETEYYGRGSVKISDNLRMVVFIGEDKATALEPEWIKYSSIVDLPLTMRADAESQLFIKSGTSFGMIKESLEEAQETCYLTEDYWRKIDRLEEYLEENTDIRFDNRFIRQMEENIAAFIACGMNKAEALDAILCEKIIPLVATEKDKILAVPEQDFSFKLDELFGFENIPLTKQAISVYGLKK